MVIGLVRWGKRTSTNKKSYNLPIKLIVLLMKTKFVAGGKSTLISFTFLSLMVKQWTVLLAWLRT
jgi:hypothetical protein